MQPTTALAAEKLRKTSAGQSLEGNVKYMQQLSMENRDVREERDRNETENEGKQRGIDVCMTKHNISGHHASSWLGSHSLFVWRMS